MARHQRMSTCSQFHVSIVSTTCDDFHFSKCHISGVQCGQPSQQQGGYATHKSVSRCSVHPECCAKARNRATPRSRSTGAPIVTTPNAIVSKRVRFPGDRLGQPVTGNSALRRVPDCHIANQRARIGSLGESLHDQSCSRMEGDVVFAVQRSVVCGEATRHRKLATCVGRPRRRTPPQVSRLHLPASVRHTDGIWATRGLKPEPVLQPGCQWLRRCKPATNWGGGGKWGRPCRFPIARRGEQVRGPCPIHCAGRPPSRSFSANLKKNAYRCFRCGSCGKVHQGM